MKPVRTAATSKKTSAFRLQTDVKSVCGTPTKTHAECMSLLRTNVKAHKGRFGPDQAPTGYGPSDLQSAYNLPSATAGSGETVAVVDAGDDPTAEADLGVYRSQYGLPACTTANGCFEKVNQEGQQSNYPPVDGTWPVEESLDIDMVSAICPNCHIVLVEANSNDDADLFTAEDEAVTLGATFVSNSWQSSEFSGEAQDDPYFDHPGVAITASAGDDGYGVGYPAASPYVTSVGGTTLTQDASTARGWTETAWDGTGSGCSAYEPKPAWQTDTGCSNRTDNDVAAVADPNTGVAIYDTTGEGGWLEVGGTSVSSPLIASVYALAGTPIAGTTPASYPYLNSSAGLNDVTSGSNGTCTPAYLCTAGPGYDGPTGLGTPDGTAAFTPVASGTLTGTVTSAATGKPVSGATVTAGDRSVTTSSTGSYSLTLAAGSYKVTATGYGYAAGSASGVQVTGGQATTQNFSLTASSNVTVSGIVTDGSGHKWPLYAKITVPGTPAAPVYTNPYTGAYSISLPAGATYTLSVAPVSPGYITATDTVKVGTTGVTRNIKVQVDTSTCIAPGYALRYDGGGTQFTGWSETKPRDGWTVTADPGGDGHTWEFGSNPTGEPVSPEPPGSDGQYAIADSAAFENGTVDTSLVSPVIDLSGVTSPDIGFDTYYYGQGGQSGEVDLSLDGGQTWASVWQQTTSTVQGPVTIPIPQAAGDSDVQVKFDYSGSRNWWWSLDNVYVGSQACAPAPGGLVAGVVTDANIGDPVNGATISEAGEHGSATSAVTGDPSVSGGYYAMFSPPGSHAFTVAATGYAAATGVVDAVHNTVTRQDWALQAGQLAMTPASSTVTDPFGAAKTVKVTLSNSGGAPAQVTLGAQDDGFTPAGASSGHQSDTAGNSSAWTKIANYPTDVTDESVVYDPQNSDVYVLGGYADGGADTPHSYAYDSSTRHWAQIADAPTEVTNAYAAVIDGTIYYVGGATQSTTLYTYTASSAAYAYNPGSNTWSQIASLPAPLAYGATAVLNGQMYVIGGCNPAGSRLTYCDPGTQVVYRYAPQDNTWTQLASYPVPVNEEACAGIDDQIACAGGMANTSEEGTGTAGTYLYNPLSNTWSQGVGMPAAAYGMTYAGANGQLQIVGGQGDVDTESGGVFRTAWQYNPASNAWSKLPGLPASVAGEDMGGGCGLYEVGGSIPTTVSFGARSQVHPATKYWGPLRSAETLPGYGQCDGAGGLGWLSETPSSITIEPGHSVTVDVRLDSAQVSQPGEYQASLYASTDTPYQVPVTDLTMDVTPSTTMREIAGTVTTAAGHPISDATVAITSGNMTASQLPTAVKTDGDGDYQLWLDGGTGSVQVSAARDGYQPQAVTVAASGKLTTENFALKPDPSNTQPYTTQAAATATKTRQAPQARARTRPDRQGGLPADVRAACPAPTKNHAECFALVRTNVKAHKGLFAPDQAPSGYGPSDLQSAYDLPSATAGSGQTVAVVDAGDDPTAEADLDVYRAQYGLPPCTTANGCFEKVNQEGRQGHYPPNLGWGDEESLDVDMISAICPNCHIILVEAKSTSIANLGASVDEAVTLGAKYVSNSYGTSGEASGDPHFNQYYDHPGVAVTASAGDSGYGVHYPAASQYVTSVGGTTLTQNPSTARGWTESVWGGASGGAGTGSGCSAYEPKPAWQTDTGCTKRTDNDVSAVADPNTGVAVYDSGIGGWEVFGGTSVASPIIASAFALAGTPAANTYPSSYPYVNASGTLNDVTSGANGTCTPAYLCTAGPGYDGPTGLGTPDGVAAFTPATYGTLSGTVANTATGDPIAGATVTVGERSVTTGSNGTYSLDLAPGSYTVTVNDYGYVAKNATGVQVTSGQATSQNFTLTAAPNVTLSGTVKDGSGHKWPLYAEITVPGTPLAPVYTNPDTGKYSITIASQATYTLDVAPVYPGYTTATQTVQIGTGNMTENVLVAIDTSTCDAPGYAQSASGTCAVTHGGLMAGVVIDANTGGPVNGATITEAGKHGSSGTSADTGDPAIPGGFYWLFSAPGSRSLTATAAGYASATAAVAVKANTVNTQNWSLQAGRLTVAPASTSATVTLGGAKTVPLTYTNTGGAPLQMTLGQQDGGYTPTGGQRQATKNNADTANVKWTNVASYPIPIEYSAVATDPRTGDVYSVGGNSSSADCTTASYVYTPSTGQWSPIAAAPQPVCYAQAAFADGTLYLVGGTTSFDHATSRSTTVYSYNPSTNDWSQVASMPAAQPQAALAVLDGDLYSIGGCGTNVSLACGGFEPGSPAVYRYDPATNAWTQLADYPTPIAGEACAGIDGEIICAGGDYLDSAGSSDSTAATYRYDPASDTWTRGADMPYEDSDMAYAGANGELQVAGGYVNRGTTSARVSQYNPGTNTWTALPSLATALMNVGGGACGMYEVGGYNGTTGATLSQVELLPGFDQCDGGGGPGWLSTSASQGSITLQPGQSVTVKVRMNSAKTGQPGTYAASLYATANTPYPVQVTDVTMNVTPPAGWILMSGKVTSTSGTPVAGATVQIDTSASSAKSGPVDYTVTTGTNGRYQWWLDPSADDSLQVIAAQDGYIQQVVTVSKPRATLGFKLSPFPSVPY